MICIRRLWSQPLVSNVVGIVSTILAGTLIAGEVRVVRDTWGVPHIHADDFESAGYASGRAQSEDTLYNVIYCLQAGVGRLAEVFGEKHLASDISARQLRHAVYAEQAWPELSPELQQLISGFCAGVNDHLREHHEDVPLQIAPVTPVQVLAWNRALLMRSAISIGRADAEASKSSGYHPDYPGSSEQPLSGEAEKDPSHPGIEPGKSNSWALAGSRTASGAPMLLIDPHWVTDGHLQLYEQWMHVGDEFHAGGFSITASPIPGMGVTPWVAWTVTAGGADSADAYALKIHPENPHQYLYDGEWLDMDVRKEVIRIRNDDGTLRNHQIEVMETQHGPVLETESGVPYAAAFGGYRNADVLEQFFRMASARTTKQFRSAIGMNRLSYFNLMWATREGTIGYVQTGQAPLRPEGFNWDRMLPGWTSDSAYLGEVPFEQLPAVIDPLSGFLQNCNTAANVVTPGITFTREDFPPNVLWGHYDSYRARGARATALLTETRDATIADGERIAFDCYVPPADLWVPVILQGVAEWEAAEQTQSESEDAQRLLEAARILGEWNRFATRDSVGTTLFRFWRLACMEVDSGVGRDRFHIPDTPEMRADAVKALQQAAGRVEDYYGRLDVPWGDVKRLRRGDHEWPVSGDGLERLGMDTLRATATDGLSDDHKLIMRRGQCITSVVELTDPPAIRSVVAYGQSNDPNSPHFADQAPLYVEESLRPVAWTLEDLEGQIESEVTYRYPESPDTVAETNGSESAEVLTSTHVYRTVAGHPIHLDVHRLPGDELRPAVVWIHGGALIVGDRDLLGNPALREELNRMLQAGMVVVSIDYRLAPETSLPGILSDVQAAWSWVHEHGRDECGIDTDRIAVAGQSAGGYLTLMAGTHLDPKPSALVAWYGYGDLTGDWLTKPNEFYNANAESIPEERAREVVGTGPASSGGAPGRMLFYLWCRQNARWVQEVTGLDPLTQTEQLKPWCPVRNVSASYPPTMLLHGSADTDVPYEQSQQMAAELERHGVQHELVIHPDGPHGFDYALLQNEDASAAVDRAVRFLRQHLTQ